MRNFIIFFTEKEGSTPLVRLLDNFKQISILHQVETVAWEPFDVNGCGPMPIDTLQDCLELFFSPGPIDNIQLNELYTKTSTKPLVPIHQEGSLGFKMRFVNPYNPLHIPGALSWNKLTHKLIQKTSESALKKAMLAVFKKHNIVVFFAVRQDLLKWGISKYHGDGSGKPGHLQFKLANGQIQQSDLSKITIDCKRLEKIIKGCEKIHLKRRHLITEFSAAGIDTYALCYEDFLIDKPLYLKRFFDRIALDVEQQEMDAVLSSEAYFKKVHSDDISTFVSNHQEVTDTIGDRFFCWQDD